MLGRGLLRNPALVQEIKGEEKLDKEKFLAFHDALCREYEKVMSGDKNVLFKMKELWFYMGNLFGEDKKAMKKIKKAQRLPEYQGGSERAVCSLAEKRIRREEIEIKNTKGFSSGRRVAPSPSFMLS